MPLHIRKQKGKQHQFSNTPCTLFVAEGDFLTDSRCNAVCLPCFNDSGSKNDPIYIARQTQTEVKDADDAFRKGKLSEQLAGQVLPVSLKNGKTYFILYLDRTKKNKENSIDLNVLEQCLNNLKHLLDKQDPNILVAFPGYINFGKPYNWDNVRWMLECFANEVRQTVWIIKKSEILEKPMLINTLKMQQAIRKRRKNVQQSDHASGISADDRPESERKQVSRTQDGI